MALHGGYGTRGSGRMRKSRAIYQRRRGGTSDDLGKQKRACWNRSRVSRCAVRVASCCGALDGVATSSGVTCGCGGAGVGRTGWAQRSWEARAWSEKEGVKCVDAAVLWCSV